MFLNPEALNPKLKGLQMIYPTLKEEWDNNCKGIEFKDFSTYQKKTVEGTGKGFELNHKDYFDAPDGTYESKWSIAPLFIDHTPYPLNARVLPKLCKTMTWLGETLSVGIVRLGPYSLLDWHFDPDPAHDMVRYRVQLPLSSGLSILSVESEERPQAEGKLQVFRSSARHKVQNHGENERFSLIFDIFRRGRGYMG